MAAPEPIVLASASPRRRALLAQAGLAFEVLAADVDETLLEPLDGVAAARALAERKARAVAARLAPEGGAGLARWVIGSDTVVALPGPQGELLLGKPEGPDEARAMLGRLAATTHRVVTGVCVVAPGGAACEAECTAVTMRALAPAEIEAYVASGEWRDKAGGYAIQESADAFVTRLEGGGFDNVVGLPVALTLALLRRLGAPGVPPEPGRAAR